MTTGLGAAFGMYKTVLLCMALAVAGGLFAGWVQPLFVGVDPILWVARAGTLWLVLFVAYLPKTDDAADRVSMGVCMLIISAVTCAACAAIQLIYMTTGNCAQAAGLVCAMLFVFETA